MNDTFNPALPAARLQLQVAVIEDAGRDTKVYRLAAPDGGRLPPAEAGAHLTLVLPVPGTSGLERQYSILQPGRELLEYAVAVMKEPGGRGGSAYIHEKLKVGDRVTVLPPRNNFPLVESAASSVLIGGGIGVTPLIAMASRLRDLHRPFQLHVGFRSAGHAVLTKQLAALPHVSVHLDDRAGALLPVAGTVAAASRDAHLYCCGPVSLIQAFQKAAADDHRNPDFCHVEFFSAAQEAATAGSFTVVLARSGRSFEIPPGKSILQVLREAGIVTLSNCEQGVCGACETRVLEGVPDHRDAVLSPADRRKGTSMMICCSGSLSHRLVLDL